MSLAPEKVLLKWMNYQLKKAGYKKEVTNFSSDLKVYMGELHNKPLYYSNIHIMFKHSINTNS